MWLLGALLAAVPASNADVVEAAPKAVVVQESSGADSATSKSVTATCPAGMRAIAGGAAISAGVFLGDFDNTALVLSDFDFTEDVPTGWHAGAREVGGGSTDTWGVHAYAVCAKSRVLTVEANAGAPDADALRLGVDCPSGTAVVGGGVGFTVTTVNLGLRLTNVSNPASLRGGWFASARETPPGTSSDWSLQMRIACSKKLRREVVTESGVQDSANVKSVVAECPDGTRALGGGASVSSSVAGVTDLVVLTASAPSGPLEAATGWRAAAQEVDAGTSGDWRVTATALCGK